MPSAKCKDHESRKGRTGRKRADIVAALPNPSGRDAVWASIRKRKTRSWTAHDILLDQDIPLRTLRGYLRALVASGIIAEVGHGEKHRKLYRLVKDQGVHAPRLRRDGTKVQQGAGTKNMWRTMKLLRAFTAEELAVTASTVDVPVTVETAKSYIKFLHRAQYLRQVTAAKAGRRGTRATFRLAKYTGPRAPQIQSVKQVWDPNLQKVVWRPKAPGAAS